MPGPSAQPRQRGHQEQRLVHRSLGACTGLGPSPALLAPHSAPSRRYPPPHPRCPQRRNRRAFPVAGGRAPSVRHPTRGGGRSAGCVLGLWAVSSPAVVNQTHPRDWAAGTGFCSDTTLACLQGGRGDGGAAALPGAWPRLPRWRGEPAPLPRGLDARGPASDAGRQCHTSPSLHDTRTLARLSLRRT